MPLSSGRSEVLVKYSNEYLQSPMTSVTIAAQGARGSHLGPGPRQEERLSFRSLEAVHRGEHTGSGSRPGRERLMELTVLSVPDCPNVPVLERRLAVLLAGRPALSGTRRAVPAPALAGCQRCPRAPRRVGTALAR